MKVSKDYRLAVKAAAEKLEKDTKKVSLEKPYGGSYVSSEINFISENNKAITMEFREIGIDRDGKFLLVLDNILG
ncbi:MAG: hypothetical protein WC146_01005 [Patescibacteria group bacterium]|jgi:hypothetical protein